RPAMFHRVRDIVRSQGLWGLAYRSTAYAYRRGVRPWMPNKPVHYAGIPSLIRFATWNLRPTILFVVHSWGGGTIRFARELADLIAARSNVIWAWGIE